MKYRDEILQPPLCLSTHKMEEKLKILEIYAKYKEMMSF